jgi:putative PIN family toxin of toxin-antitoxin system
MKHDRVVLDTSIYVSLILSKHLDDLVVWSKDQNISIYVSTDLLTELKRVLSRPHIRKNLTQPPADYIRFIKLLTQQQSIDLRFDRAPDIKDNYLFDLAYTVKSYYLVTHDKPLLNLKQVNKIKVISLAEWKKRVASTSI